MCMDNLDVLDDLWFDMNRVHLLTYIDDYGHNDYGHNDRNE